MTQVKTAKNAPLLISIGGMSGTGKTTLAANLAKILPDAVVIDSDRVRKKILGYAETERLPPEGYSPEAGKKMGDEIDRLAREGLRLQKTVIISSTCLEQWIADKYETLAQECAARFIGIWLQAGMETLVSRVSARTNNPSDAGVDAVHEQASTTPSAPKGWAVVDAAQPPEGVLKSALDILNKTGGAGAKCAGPSLKT